MMATLSSFPTEILQQIGQAIVDRHDGSPGYNYGNGLTDIRTTAQIIYQDLASLSRSCRKLHGIFDPLLYKFAALIRDARTLMLAYATSCPIPASTPLPDGLDCSAQDGNVRILEVLLENGHYPSQPLRISVPSLSIGMRGFPGTLPGCCGSVNDLQAATLVDGRNQRLLSRLRMSRPNFANAPRNVGGVHWLGDERLNPPQAIERRLEWMEEVARRYDPDPETKDDSVFWSPLHAAAANGHIEALARLLDHGADINAPSRGYCFCTCPVDLAVAATIDFAYTDNPQIPLPWTNQGWNKQFWVLGEWTPLHHAICHGQVEAAKYLLSRGASVIMDSRKNSTLTALHFAAGLGNTRLMKEIARSPRQRQFGINIRDDNGFTPFYWAQRNGRWDTTAKWLVNKGAPIDQYVRHYYRSPVAIPILGEALLWRRYGAAEALLELGADPAANRCYFTALECLCINPCPSPYRLAFFDERETFFLDSLVEFDEDRENVFRFDTKVEEKRCKLISKLRERGAEVVRPHGIVPASIRTDLGFSALGIAIFDHITEAVKCILEGGSEPVNPLPATVECDNPMPFYLAICLAGLCREPYRSMPHGLKTLQCLLDYADKMGCGVETATSALHMLLSATASCPEGQRALQCIMVPQTLVAKYRYFGDSVRLVLARGADPLSVDSAGRTAFWTAFSFCDRDILELLLETKFRPGLPDLLALLFHPNWRRFHHAMLDEAFQSVTGKRLLVHNWPITRLVLRAAWKMEDEHRRMRLLNTAAGLFADADARVHAAFADEILIWACVMGSIHLAEQALELGANVNGVIKRPIHLHGICTSELSPLMAALLFRDREAPGDERHDTGEELVKMLLEAGADALMRQAYESPMDRSKAVTMSALEWMVLRPWRGISNTSSCTSHVNMVGLLLQYHPDCLRPQLSCTIRGHNAQHSLGPTIIHRAIMPDKTTRWPTLPDGGNAPLLGLLLRHLIEHGAEAREPDADNDTPLGLFLSLLLENPARLIRTRLAVKNSGMEPPGYIVRDDLLGLLRTLLYYKDPYGDLISKTDGLSVAEKLRRLQNGEFEMDDFEIVGERVTKDMVCDLVDGSMAGVKVRMGNQISTLRFTGDVDD